MTKSDRRRRSGRRKTVEASANPRWSAQTGVPMLLTTSFNESEPIINAPVEALDYFRRRRIDRW